MTELYHKTYPSGNLKHFNANSSPTEEVEASESPWSWSNQAQTERKSPESRYAGTENPISNHPQKGKKLQCRNARTKEGTYTITDESETIGLAGDFVVGRATPAWKT